MPLELFDGVTGLGIRLYQALDLAEGRQHGRVILASELLTELRIADLAQLARQIHRDLTGSRDRLVALGAVEVGELHVEVARDFLLHRLDGEGVRGLGQEVLERLLREVDGDRLIVTSGRVPSGREVVDWA